ARSRRDREHELLQERHALGTERASRRARDRSSQEGGAPRLDGRPARGRGRYARDVRRAAAALALRRPLRVRKLELRRVDAPSCERRRVERLTAGDRATLADGDLGEEEHVAVWADRFDVIVLVSLFIDGDGEGVLQVLRERLVQLGRLLEEL